MYLELTEAVVTKSAWATSGDCYMSDQLARLLRECVEHDWGEGGDSSGDCSRIGDIGRQSRDYAAALLSQYSDVLK